MPKKKEPLSTGELSYRLETRYDTDEYAFLPEVRNCTGYSRQIRTADALVMSLWPSRGIELMGFEIKASRGDWLKELKEPSKAEAIATYCDRWYIVANLDVVKLEELPSGWGLIVPRGKGLVISKKCPDRTATPLNKDFLASVLRSVKTSLLGAYVRRASIDDKIKEARRKGEELANSSLKWNHQQVQTDYQNMKDAVNSFEQASGIQIHKWNSGNQGAALKAFMNTDMKAYIGDLEQMKRNLERLSLSLDESLKTLKEERDGSGECTGAGKSGGQSTG